MLAFSQNLECQLGEGRVLVGVVNFDDEPEDIEGR